MAERYHIGDLTVDTNTGTVTRSNETLSLSPLTFRLLAALARRAPNVVSRQELLETVWPDEFVNDETLSQRVRVLRESLGDLSENPRYISALRGWGYRLVAPVERIEAPLASAGAIHSLAVLPLTNITGDSQLEYFADGMTESLISALAKISALKVISRTSVMTYRNTKKQVPQIAHELGVDAVVEGTVLVTKERVRVSAQLVYAATDEHLWAEIYDRDLGDVLALHSELAQAIAREIRTVVTPEEAERLERKSRVAPAVLEAHLKGRYFLAKFTPPDIDRAIGWFERAIAGDDLFAEAHAGLAYACLLRGIPLGAREGVRRQRQFLARAKAAAERAVSLDEKLTEAHAAAGIAHLFKDWDWSVAKRSLERALDLEPNSPYLHFYCAALASTRLDRAETLGELRRAIELDPVNLFYLSVAAEFCYWVRDYSQSVIYASQALDLDPSYHRAHYILGRVHEAQGRIEETIAEYEKAGLFTSEGSMAARRAFQDGQAAGYHRWALAARIGDMGGPPLDGSTVPHHDRERTVYYHAKNYARLGDADNAIKFLKQSYKERDCLLVLLKAHEWWDPLRSDPRFQDLVQRVGIP
jgi:TolB-like protein